MEVFNGNINYKFVFVYLFPYKIFLLIGDYKELCHVPAYWGFTIIHLRENFQPIFNGSMVLYPLVTGTALPSRISTWIMDHSRWRSLVRQSPLCLRHGCTMTHSCTFKKIPSGILRMSNMRLWGTLRRSHTLNGCRWFEIGQKFCMKHLDISQWYIN